MRFLLRTLLHIRPFATDIPTKIARTAKKANEQTKKLAKPIGKLQKKVEKTQKKIVKKVKKVVKPIVRKRPGR